MTEQIPNQNPVQENPSKLGVVRGYLGKIAGFLAPFWEAFKRTKFYTNKKIFYPITGMFGLMFLIVILGILFGKRSSTPVITTRPTPSPFVVKSEATPTPGDDVLSQAEQKLFDIKTRMDGFDAKQGRLQPPTLNFKIEF